MSLCVPPACQAVGTGMMLSSWATSSIEEVAEAAPAGLRWLQLYMYKDRAASESLVRRAERAGYRGIFVTVDTPYLGRRVADVRNKFQLPSHLRYLCCWVWGCAGAAGGAACPGHPLCACTSSCACAGLCFGSKRNFPGCVHTVKDAVPGNVRLLK